jgi:DUF4097 and DUF4098 domain-containing protein YvlB
MSVVARRSFPILLILAVAAFGPAWALETVTEERSLGPGGQLLVDASSASVSVAGSSGASTAKVEISGKTGWRDDFELKIEKTEGRVAVFVERRNERSGFWGWLFGGSGSGIRVDVTVPEETTVEVDTSGGSIELRNLIGPVVADTSGGNIEARAMRGRIVADTSGGSIVLEDVEGPVEADTSGGRIELLRIAGDAQAETSGGSITARSIRGRLAAETSGGSIEIDDVSGRVEAETSGGSIYASFAPGNGQGGRLRTSGGDVRVKVDASLGLDIDASSSGGSVISDVRIETQGQSERGRLSGRLAGGGPRLELRTSGGSIRIEPLD